MPRPAAIRSTACASTCSRAPIAASIIGHDDGVITIDLAESDPAYRERLRGELDEPYRTMLGHFRHEVGHYFQWQLVEVGDDASGSRVPRAVRRRDAPTTRPRSTGTTPRARPAGWEAVVPDDYATMHPYEDFAETWAHYLHICDTVETASSTV